MDELSDFLKAGEDTGNEPEAVETPQAEAVAPEPVAEATPETAERPRGPDGKFIPKGEKQPETPEQGVSPTPEPQLDHAALLGERRRRQEAEDRLKALEAQLAQPQQPQAPTEAPDIWDDPEAYRQHVIAQAVQAAAAEARETYRTQRITESAERAMAKYPDYLEKHAIFGEMIKQTPGLFEKMLQAPDPAEFAYNQAKTEAEIRQHGGLDALVNAKVEAALAAKAAEVPATPAPEAPIPDTLADAQSSRAGGTAFTVPTLDDILRR